MSIRWDSRNKRWRFEFDRRLPTGRHRSSRLLPKGWTRAQADKYDHAESGRLYAVAAGVERPQRLIDDAVLVYLQERGPSLRNLHNLEGQFAVMFAAYTGRPITDLPAVAREYASQQAGILSPGTIRNRIAYLRAACRYAWKHHAMTEHDPAARLVVPKVDNARTVYLERSQVLAICRRINNRQARAAAWVAFFSGMRCSEVLAAEVVGDSFVLHTSKTGKPRVVPIHPRIAGIVRSMWPLQITTWTCSHAFTRAAREAGIEGVTFHTLRHSAASAMINAGVDLYAVGGVLGHASPQSTQRYAHLAVDRLREALNTIGRRNLPHTAPRRTG